MVVGGGDMELGLDLGMRPWGVYCGDKMWRNIRGVRDQDIRTLKLQRRCDDITGCGNSNTVSSGGDGITMIVLLMILGMLRGRRKP